MDVLSNSRLSYFRACPRRYELAYRRGRVPLLSATPLNVGSAWHKAMEAYWRDGREAAINWLITQAENIDEVEVAKLVALLRHYNPPTELYKVLAVEQEFVGTVQGRRRIRFGGRFDMLVERISTGRRWLVEHKTSSEEIVGWGSYWKRLNLDAQSSLYLLYEACEGIIYDVVRKPGFKLSKIDEGAAQATGRPVVDCYLERVSRDVEANTEAYFQFREIRKTSDDLASAADDLADYVGLLRSCERTGRFPKNTDACRGLFGNCVYIDVCSGSASLDDDTLFKDRENHSPVTP
jgi:hypothetical protein